MFDLYLWLQGRHESVWFQDNTKLENLIGARYQLSTDLLPYSIHNV